VGVLVSLRRRTFGGEHPDLECRRSKSEPADVRRPHFSGRRTYAVSCPHQINVPGSACLAGCSRRWLGWVIRHAVGLSPRLAVGDVPAHHPPLIVQVADERLRGGSLPLIDRPESAARTASSSVPRALRRVLARACDHHHACRRSNVSTKKSRSEYRKDRPRTATASQWPRPPSQSSRVLGRCERVGHGTC
jgi:hypothetical protein